MILFLLFLACLDVKSCHGIDRLTAKTLSNEVRIPHDYNKNVRPMEGRGPVRVNVSLYIHDISKIDAESMNIEMDVILYLQWQDDRIEVNTSSEKFDTYSHGDIVLPGDVLNYLWQPVPYIENLRQASLIKMTDNFMLTSVDRDENIGYRTRLYLVIGCQMNFQDYPVDMQSCPINIRSFAYDTNHVQFGWLPPDETDGRPPVDYNKEMKLLQFELKPLNLIQTDRDAANFSTLTIDMVFIRFQGYIFVQVFLPSFLVVALSWLTFYMGLDVVPARTGLLITGFLALITMFSSSGTGGDVPSVSYMKGIDLWMSVCLLYSFAAICELVIVKYLDVLEKFDKEIANSRRMSMLNAPRPVPDQIPPKMALENNGQQPPMRETLVTRIFAIPQIDNKPITQYVSPSCRSLGHKCRVPRIIKIEFYSRIFFPLSFLIFALIYLPLLMTRTLSSII